jgi:hypothetical protein
LEPSGHWARPSSERSGRGRCVGPNAISGCIREADSAHAARGDRSGQSGGIDVLRLEDQGHKAAAHAANRLTRPHRHKPSGDTAICVDHGCQSPRAFLIWEIWAKADICGQNTITATPRISPRAIISVARFGKLTDLLHEGECFPKIAESKCALDAAGIIAQLPIGSLRLQAQGFLTRKGRHAAATASTIGKPAANDAAQRSDRPLPSQS